MGPSIVRFFKVLGKESKKTPKVGVHSTLYISKPTHVQTPSVPSGMKNLLASQGLQYFQSSPITVWE